MVLLLISWLYSGLYKGLNPSEVFVISFLFVNNQLYSSVIIVSYVVFVVIFSEIVVTF
jgi:hypothetical protein